VTLAVFDRETLARASPDALVRLARFLSVPLGEGPVDVPALVEAIADRLGPKRGWPPRYANRRW
jgi:hypothetical protein